MIQYGAVLEWLGRETELLWEKCVPAPLCYNYHTGLAWDQTWDCMVRG